MTKRRSTTLLSTVLCMVLASVGVGSSFAQDRDDRAGRGRNDSSQRGDHREYRDYREYRDGRGDRRDRRGDHRGHWQDNHWQDNRWQDKHHDRWHDRAHGGPYHRGAGPSHSFYPGQRLPYDYRVPQYVVEDWRGHRLSAPPRGYHWVQSGADYILVAITTGVILQLLLGN